MSFASKSPIEKVDLGINLIANIVTVVTATSAPFLAFIAGKKQEAIFLILLGIGFFFWKRWFYPLVRNFLVSLSRKIFYLCKLWKTSKLGAISKVWNQPIDYLEIIKLICNRDVKAIALYYHEVGLFSSLEEMQIHYFSKRKPYKKALFDTKSLDILKQLHKNDVVKMSIRRIPSHKFTNKWEYYYNPLNNFDSIIFDN